MTAREDPPWEPPPNCPAPVREDDIHLFTMISGDHNPLHYDTQASESSGFGRIIVQGGVTSAILNAVVAEKLPGPGTVFMSVSWNVTPYMAMVGSVS